jgi:thiol:disulfide interchange protein
MKVILLALAFWSLVVHPSSAQIFDPVTWNFQTKEFEDNVFELIATATIQSGWHIYALTVSDDPNTIGPIPTTFTFSDSKDCTALGKMREGKFITHFDPNFEMDLNYFENNARFTRRFKRTNALAFQLTGRVEFMACDDERCIFPDPVDFSLEIPGKSGESASSSPEPDNASASPPPSETSSGILDPIHWEVKSVPVGENLFEIIYTSTADKGWHLYSQHLESNEGPVPTAFDFDPADGVEYIGPVTEEKPIRKYDPSFMMNVDYFEGSAEFRQRVRTSVSPFPVITTSVNYMCCDDEKCLPPTSRHARIDLATGKVEWFDPEATGETLTPGAKDPFRIDRADPSSPLSNCGEEKEHHSLWSIFILGILGGLLALVTPCVFPMIPLTVSFFTKSSGGSRGKQRAMTYGFFIFLIYVLLSLPFHLSRNVDPEVLNNIATNVWLNLAFFLVFVVFAASFFGYFEISLPSGLANRVDRGSSLKGGVGIFFMALTLAIVSFSCTGPILGSVIGSIYASNSSGTFSFLGVDWSLPAAKVSSAMMGFGLSLGLPFALFAAFPGMLKKLPKSGGWLEDFKVSLGFAEMALALKFLSNADLVQQWGFVKRELFFGIWIVIGLFWVLYLLGKFRFKPGQGSAKTSRFKLAFALFLAGFTLRLIPGLFPPSELNRFAFLSGFPPPRSYSYYHFKEEYKIYRDLTEAMAAAKRENKPVFLDFTGWACVNCRKMEENVWPKATVTEILSRDYIMCSLYVDEKVELPLDQQITYTTADGRTKQIRTVGNKWATLQTETFHNNSQPFYALLAPDSTLLAPTRQYDPDVAEFGKWLQCGLSSFRESPVASTE